MLIEYLYMLKCIYVIFLYLERHKQLVESNRDRQKDRVIYNGMCIIDRYELNDINIDIDR